MFDNLLKVGEVFGDLDKWKDLLEKAGIDLSKVPELIGKFDDINSPQDLITQLKKLDIDFDAQKLMQAFKDADIFDKDGDDNSLLGSLFGG